MRKLISIATAATISIATAIALATPAAAITEVPCDSGPPTPILLSVAPGNAICFGGTVGLESVGVYAEGLNGGGYYGYIYTDNGSQCIRQEFYPNETIGIFSYVCAIEITPPF